MNDQLKRIREKDYSQMDQKLLENMTRADNLNTALFQLSDFQKFLVNQIALLNQQKDFSVKSNQISKSLIKNFDYLKQSIVKCSRLRDRAQIKTIESLKNSIKQTKNQLQIIKRQIQRQIKQTIQQNNKVYENHIKQIIANYELERSKNQNLSRYYKQLQREKAIILQQNEELKQKLSTKHTSKGYKKSESMHFEDQVLRPFTQISQNDTSTLQSAHTMQNQTSKSIKKRILQQSCNKFSSHNSVYRQPTQSDALVRRNSSKRLTLNHSIQRKQHFQTLQGKQNEAAILRSKGIKIQEPRPKSKQKLKLFSML